MADVLTREACVHLAQVAQLRGGAPVAAVRNGALLSPSAHPVRFVPASSRAVARGEQMDVVITLRFPPPLQPPSSSTTPAASPASLGAVIALWRPPAAPGGGGLLLLWRPHGDDGGGGGGCFALPSASAAAPLSYVHAETLDDAVAVAVARIAAAEEEEEEEEEAAEEAEKAAAAEKAAKEEKKGKGTKEDAQPPLRRTASRGGWRVRTLRVLFDGSAVEAFTCDGAALATRAYRGAPCACGAGGGAGGGGEATGRGAAEGAAEGGAQGALWRPVGGGALASTSVALSLLSMAGEARVVAAQAWGMKSIWPGEGV